MKSINVKNRILSYDLHLGLGFIVNFGIKIRMSRKYLWKAILLAVAGIIVGSCSLKKGYEALHIYNYFEAKKQFEKSIGKKNQSPASYGLSVIYYRKDNPFHNMDSAYHFGVLAVNSYDSVKEKKQMKWKKKLDYTLGKVEKHRQTFTFDAYQNTIRQNTVGGFDAFMKKYPWFNLMQQAVKQRDSLAFLLADNEHSSSAYAQYLKNYPQSKWINESKEQLFQAQYRETVESGKTASYIQFIEKFPQNPLVQDAKYQIYTIETENKTIASYDAFIKNYPNNPFIADAWKQLYRLSIAVYNTNSIQYFDQKYPNFPYPELIAKDLQLVGKELLQYFEDGKYGFIDHKGKIIIPAKYAFAGQFHDGLAIILKNEKYGFIDKEGKEIIPCQYDNVFDFSQGRAIVEKEGKLGVIDVTGNFVFPLKFDDIGPFYQGLSYAQKGEQYQYYTLDGTLAFSASFDEAFSFKNGIAKVKMAAKEGFINEKGQFIVAVKQGDIRHFSQHIFVHEYRDSACFIYLHDTLQTSSCFSRIGVLHENRAIVVRGHEYGYVDSTGTIVIPITHDIFSNYFQFAAFKNGFALTKRNTKFALMDSLGKRFYPAIFNGIGTHGILTPVSKGNGWGYANDNVRLIIDYQFDYAGTFINNRAIVERNNLYGLINIDGTEIIPIIFTEIQRLSPKLFLVTQNGKKSLYNSEGKALVPLKYIKINQFSTTIYQLIGDGFINYYDISNEKLILPNG